MRALFLAVVLAGCDAGDLNLQDFQEAIGCHVKRCATGLACIEGECRQICRSDADCETCCLTAGKPDEGIPNTCAPKEYCP